MGFPVTSERALKLEQPSPDERFTLFSEGDALYYSTSPTVSASSKDGTLLDGETVVLSKPKWVRSAGHSVVQMLSMDNEATQAELDEAAFLERANTFKTTQALTPAAGGPEVPAGSRSLEIAEDGTVRVGPSPLRDASTKRDMAPTLFRPDSHRSIVPTVDALLVGDPPEFVGGRRYGDFPYTPATVVTTAQFIAKTDTTLTVKWPATFVTAWYEAGLIAKDEESLMPDPTEGFGTSGTLVIEPAGGGTQFAILTLSGKTANTLTVSATVAEQSGSLTFASAALVTQLLDTDSTLRIDYAEGWVGNGGYQDRAVQVGSKTTEVHRRTTDSGYSSGGKRVWTVSTKGEGKDSIRREVMELEDDGSLLIVGGWAEDSTKATARLTVGGRTARAPEIEQDPAGGTIEADSFYGWPASGVVDDGNGHVFSYAKRTVKVLEETAYVEGSGKLAKSAKLKLAPRTQIVNIAARGGQVAANYGQGVAQTKIGNIGPTTATPEGGLTVGSGTGDTTLYRKEASVWATKERLLAEGGVGTKHVGAETPTGGTSGDIRVGTGKLWVNDAGTWKSVAVA